MGSACFQVGQRVIVTGWTLDDDDPANGMNGYYGHVVKVDPPNRIGETTTNVALIGRVGYPARERDLRGPNNPWTMFYASELKAAD